jgi:hypothetical protein
MTMIRNLMFGLSLLALTGASAGAAPVAKTHSSKAKVVAQATPAGDTAAPADKPAPAKKEKKHATKKSTKAEAPKGDAAKSEGSKEMKAAPEKAAEKAPAPATN